MRQTFTRLVAGAALAVTIGAAPASACEVVNPCGGGLFQGAFGYSAGYGYQAERLPDPTGPQYYYVNHGPLYTGPGNLAPAPTYQERAVTGWQGYNERAYYGYNGGPYANAGDHYYDGAPDVRGPVVYTVPHRTHYRPYRVGPKYYYTARPSHRYGYGYRVRPAHYGYNVRPGYAPRLYGSHHSMMHGPRMHGMPRYAAPRYRPGPYPQRYKF